MKLTKLSLLLMETDGPAYIVAARSAIHPSILSKYKLGQMEIPRHHLDQLCRTLSLILERDVEEDDVLGYVEVQV